MVLHPLQNGVNNLGSVYCLCNFAPRHQGQKNNLEFDIEQSSDRVLQWKAHVLRAINQERAKSRSLDNLENTNVLLSWTGP